MEARVTPVLELDAAEVDAWRALAARAAEPNPYFEPGFVVAAARHLGSDPVLVGVWRGPELVFAAPFVARPRWRKLPLRSVAGWCHDHCFVGTPLLHPDHDVGVAAWRSALAGLRELDPAPRLAVLERFTVDGPVGAALLEAVAPDSVTTYEAYETATLERRLDADRPVAGLSGRHRRELGRRARQVEQLAGGPYETRDLVAEPGALDEFLDLEAAGWKGSAGSALASSEATRAFVVEALGTFAAEGRMVLLATVAHSSMAAAVCIVRTGGTISMFKTAFDESLARYSPGTQLVVDLVEWFRSDPSLELIDTCAAPDNAFANRLFPDRRPMATLVVPFDRPARTALAVVPRFVAWSRAVRRRS